MLRHALEEEETHSSSPCTSSLYSNAHRVVSVHEVNSCSKNGLEYVSSFRPSTRTQRMKLKFCLSQSRSPPVDDVGSVRRCASTRRKRQSKRKPPANSRSLLDLIDDNPSTPGTQRAASSPAPQPSPLSFLSPQSRLPNLVLPGQVVSNKQNWCWLAASVGTFAATGVFQRFGPFSQPPDTDNLLHWMAYMSREYRLRLASLLKHGCTPDRRGERAHSMRAVSRALNLFLLNDAVKTTLQSDSMMVTDTLGAMMGNAPLEYTHKGFNSASLFMSTIWSELGGFDACVKFRVVNVIGGATPDDVMNRVNHLLDNRKAVSAVDFGMLECTMHELFSDGGVWVNGNRTLLTRKTDCEQICIQAYCCDGAPEMFLQTFSCGTNFTSASGDRATRSLSDYLAPFRIGDATYHPVGLVEHDNQPHYRLHMRMRRDEADQDHQWLTLDTNSKVIPVLPDPPLNANISVIVWMARPSIDVSSMVMDTCAASSWSPEPAACDDRKGSAKRACHEGAAATAAPPSPITFRVPNAKMCPQASAADANVSPEADEPSDAATAQHASTESSRPPVTDDGPTLPRGWVRLQGNEPKTAEQDIQEFIERARHDAMQHEGPTRRPQRKRKTRVRYGDVDDV